MTAAKFSLGVLMWAFLLLEFSRPPEGSRADGVFSVFSGSSKISVVAAAPLLMMAPSLWRLEVSSLAPAFSSGGRIMANGNSSNVL